jgi:hypothetical protein
MLIEPRYPAGAFLLEKPHMESFRQIANAIYFAATAAGGDDMGDFHKEWETTGPSVTGGVLIWIAGREIAGHSLDPDNPNKWAEKPQQAPPVLRKGEPASGSLNAD